MVKITGTTITMTRGDTLLLEVGMTDTSGNAYTPVEGDLVRFAVKKSYNDRNTVIYKEIPNDTLILRLEPEDTKRMSFGKYVYDIQITFADGTVDTFIAEAQFILAEEVE